MADNGHQEARHGGLAGPLRWLQSLPNDSPAKAVVVTLLVCILASVLVAASAVLLRPKQIANKQDEQRRQIASILQGVTPKGNAWRSVTVTDLEARVVELASGRYVDGIDPATFDQRRMARDPAHNTAIPPRQGRSSNQNPGEICRREPAAEGRQASQLIVLPVYGRGFGSTLYGYIGLSADTKTVIGLAFYQHGETPGLGALIDDSTWRKSWSGKKIWTADGEVGLGVARGPVVPGSAEAQYHVDGLTGATWTGQGVTNLLRYWLGEHGFGPYLKRLRRAAR